MEEVVEVKYVGFHCSPRPPKVFSSLKDACDYALSLDKEVRHDTFGDSWDDDVAIKYGRSTLTNVRKDDISQDLLFRCTLMLNQLKIYESTNVPAHVLGV